MLQKEKEKKKEILSVIEVAQKGESSESEKVGTSEATHEKGESNVQGEKSAKKEDLNVPLSSFLRIYSSSPKKTAT